MARDTHRWTNRLDSRTTRLVAVALLLVGLGVACVGFDTLEPDPGENRFPGTTDVLDYPERYLGDRVVVSGRVDQVAPVRIVETYTTSRDGAVVTRSAQFTVTDLRQDVTPGETVQVFGTLTDPRTVRASNAFTVPAGNFLYMYAVSALAGLWVLGRLLRGWRLEWAGLRLRPRDDRLDPRARLGRWLDGEADPDGEEDRDA